ncbi:hypothetical protein AOLI_G00273740 [Acnodon oligacanthus]
MNQYLLATSSILPLETGVSLRRETLFWEEQDDVRQMPKSEFWVQCFCQSAFCFRSTFQQISPRPVVRDTKESINDIPPRCVKMANKRTVQEILLNVLESLNDGEQKMFQWYLSQEALDKYPHIPKAKIKGASLEETVNQLIDNSAAAKITEMALERMNQKHLARRLEEALEKG